MSLDLAKIRALPHSLAMQELAKAERAYIVKEIHPVVQMRFKEAGERIEFLDIEGDGENKWLRWEAVDLDRCDGCDGSGRIASNRGTKTDCPDCDGSGETNGSIREFCTDYDGMELTA